MSEPGTGTTVQVSSSSHHSMEVVLLSTVIIIISTVSSWTVTSWSTLVRDVDDSTIRKHPAQSPNPGTCVLNRAGQSKKRAFHPPGSLIAALNTEWWSA